MVFMRRATLVLSVLMAGVSGGSAYAQRSGSENYLGASIGTYMPTQSRVREAFGSSMVSYGITVVQPYRPNSARLRFDVDSLSLSRNGNRFFFIGGSAGYTVGFGPVQGENRNAGFLRIGAGPAYFDYDVTQNFTKRSGRRLALYGTAEAGYTVAKNILVSTRYVQTPKFDGYDFSGVELRLTFAAFKL